MRKIIHYAIISSLLGLATPAFAQSTSVTDFIKQIVDAMNLSQEKKLEKMILPASVQHLKRNNPEQYKRTLKLLSQNKIPNGSEIKIVDIRETGGFDAATNTYQTPEKSLVYPSAPSHIIYIFKRNTDQPSSLLFAYAVGTVDGKWYLFLPTIEIIKQQNGQKS